MLSKVQRVIERRGEDRKGYIYLSLLLVRLKTSSDPRPRRCDGDDRAREYHASRARQYHCVFLSLPVLENL